MSVAASEGLSISSAPRDNFGVKIVKVVDLLISSKKRRTLNLAWEEERILRGSKEKTAY